MPQTHPLFGDANTSRQSSHVPFHWHRGISSSFDRREYLSPAARGNLPFFCRPRRIPSFFQRRSRTGCPRGHLSLWRHLRHSHRPPRDIPILSLPDPTHLGFLVHITRHRYRLSVPVHLL